MSCSGSGLVVWYAMSVGSPDEVAVRLTEWDATDGMGARGH